MPDKKPSLTFARPRFATLEEFKESINAMADSIVPNLPSDITDEEWEEYYKEFIEGMKEGEEEQKKKE
jgi:hypothetical protein